MRAHAFVAAAKADTGTQVVLAARRTYIAGIKPDGSLTMKTL